MIAIAPGKSVAVQAPGGNSMPQEIENTKKKFMKEKILALASVLILASFDLVEAQQVAKPLPRIGFIYSTGSPEAPSPHTILFEAFRLSLRDLGYVEGKNILIERRYAEGTKGIGYPTLSNDLCATESRCDCRAGNNVAIQAARKTTGEINPYCHGEFC